MMIEALALMPGAADGTILRLDEPLSLWGGIDLQTTIIIDHTHPQRGATIAGRIIAMKTSRGSSSSASALVEIARQGLAPAAIILSQRDPILVMGALTADDLYGVRIAIVMVAPEHWPLLSDGVHVRIHASDGKATLDLDRP